MHHLACPLARLLRCTRKHISHQYALAGAPCIRTKIRRDLAHLFFAETLTFQNAVLIPLD